MNKAGHLITGTAAGAGTYALIKRATKQPASVEEAAVVLFASLIGGIGPDFLEPATNPHHRQIFHSLLFGLLIGYGIHKVWKWEQGPLVLRIGLITLGAGCLMHLICDGFTPRSIPIT